MSDPFAFKKLIWHFLITHGGALKPPEDRWDNKFVNFYGCCLNADADLTIEALENIKKHGIDYDKCSDLKDDVGTVFNGTFADEDETISYMYGTLVTNGTEYLWAMQSEPLGLTALTKIMMNPITFESALESLEERVTAPYFDRGCKI